MLVILAKPYTHTARQAGTLDESPRHLFALRPLGLQTRSGHPISPVPHQPPHPPAHRCTPLPLAGSWHCKVAAAAQGLLVAGTSRLGSVLTMKRMSLEKKKSDPLLPGVPVSPPPSLSSYQPASAACPTPPRPQQDLPFGIPGPPNRCVPGPAALRLPAKAAANARRRLARRTRLNEQLKTIRQHASVVISVAIRQSETSSADPPSLRESYEIRTGLTASDLSFALCARDRSPPLQPTHNSQIVAAISTCVAQGNHVVRCHRHNAGQL